MELDLVSMEDNVFAQSCVLPNIICVCVCVCKHKVQSCHDKDIVQQWNNYSILYIHLHIFWYVEFSF